ncbi:hypothetical protein CRI94_10395 [Longibacter salinarum]|uniref:Uncharacterized protein n=1 Tax=Longibacter salinarum TaxID=1850348 RepID=A0A2A8CWN3_9BACT|nr:hypothetical protein [Longibacter salinarum]PEN13056.1 hypothetical protein CRI94_10395 [Longibacter salinarum]
MVLLHDRLLEDRSLPRFRLNGSSSRHDPTSTAVGEARRDLEMLKAMARRLSKDCKSLVVETDADRTATKNEDADGRNALHLQARAEAIATLIRDTERVLDRLDAQAATG